MTTQPRSSPEPARRNETSRRAILSAAHELAGEAGHAALSVESIADRAGVGKQTIHRWWPSKGAVLLDAFIVFADGPDGELAALPDTGDLEADLKTALRATVAELSDPRHGRALRALATEILGDPDLAAVHAERLEAPTAERRRERLRSAQRAGQLPEDLDLDMAVEMLWGAVRSRWMLRSGPLTPDYADAVVEAALSGLRLRT